MKREILCTKCRMSLIGKIGEYLGEGHKSISGKSRVDCYCDHCLATIRVGYKCYALSIWSTRSPYYEWEGEYISVS